MLDYAMLDIMATAFSLMLFFAISLRAMPRRYACTPLLTRRHADANRMAELFFAFFDAADTLPSRHDFSHYAANTMPYAAQHAALPTIRLRLLR